MDYFQIPVIDEFEGVAGEDLTIGAAVTHSGPLIVRARRQDDEPYTVLGVSAQNAFAGQAVRVWRADAGD